MSVKDILEKVSLIEEEEEIDKEEKKKANVL